MSGKNYSPTKTERMTALLFEMGKKQTDGIVERSSFIEAINERQIGSESYSDKVWAAVQKYYPSGWGWVDISPATNEKDILDAFHKIYPTKRGKEETNKTEKSPVKKASGKGMLESLVETTLDTNKKVNQILDMLSEQESPAKTIQQQNAIMREQLDELKKSRMEETFFS